MSNSDNHHVIILTGPTAVGKSSTLLKLAELSSAPVISADSRQVYKELSIGTDKPDAKVIAATRLQLVDHISIHDNYTAGTYEEAAMSIIEEAHKNGLTPIISGGTGLYIKAVCEGLDKIPRTSDEIRTQLNQEAAEKGLNHLVIELEKSDPEYFKTIDSKNTHRIIRALAVIRETGNKFSSYQNQRSPRKFTPIYVVLERDRKELYKRIDDRVLHMFKAGLVAEAKPLIAHRHLKALQTVGYSEVFQHMDGTYDLDKCISEIQKNTRRYAKRQMTWFRNQMNAQRFHPDDIEGMKTLLAPWFSK